MHTVCVSRLKNTTLNSARALSITIVFVTDNTALANVSCVLAGPGLQNGNVKRLIKKFLVTIEHPFSILKSNA